MRRFTFVFLKCGLEQLMKGFVVKFIVVSEGKGTPLKDIPNVAYKVSRKKCDEVFKLLHTILFGGRSGKAAQIKTNILLFSGYKWQGDEEKAKEKVKEKLDKCNKEKLLEFCDLFDISVAKATIKKEDIVAKLFEFLEKPHATTDVTIDEKEKLSIEKVAKRKQTPKKSSPAVGSSSSKRSAKSQKETDEVTRTDKKSSSHSDDESEEDKEEKEEEKEQEAEEEEEWDCGLACVLMVLRASGITTCTIEDLAQICSTKSICTVDLAYLLQKLCVEFSYFTITFGANPNYSIEEFYKEQLPEDLVRVDLLFKKAPKFGIIIQNSCPMVNNHLLLDSEGKCVVVKYCFDDWPTNATKLAFEKYVFSKTYTTTART